MGRETGLVWEELGERVEVILSKHILLSSQLINKSVTIDVKISKHNIECITQSSGSLTSHREVIPYFVYLMANFSTIDNYKHCQSCRRTCLIHSQLQ